MNIYNFDPDNGLSSEARACVYRILSRYADTHIRLCAIEAFLLSSEYRGMDRVYQDFVNGAYSADLKYHKELGQLFNETTNSKESKNG